MAVPPYRLETFGKLALAGSATPGVSHQRRRLALLALLASSGEKGLSRDQLLGYLWPDSSSANGRHSLEQLLHGMRRSLDESIFLGTNPLSLDPEVITSDVNVFDRAFSTGDFASAVSVVAGPFLDGFYLDDAPEFERWSSMERERLTHRYSEALQHLAEEAERLGDFAGAVRWRRSLVKADPVSSRSALSLMRALASAGDRTAALQHARVYETLVRQELDSAPDPSVIAYAAALRAGAEDNALATPMETKPVSIAPSVDLDSPPPRADRAPQTVLSKAPSRIPSGIRYGAAAGLVVIAMIAAGLFLARRNHNVVPTADRIAVVPFRVTGADSLKYLGEGIVDLISPMLTGEGGPIGIDSRTSISAWNRIKAGREGTGDDARRVAREVGSDLVLSGSIVEVGGRLTITGSVLSASSPDIRQLAAVSAPADSIDRLLDRFVAQLLATQSGVPAMSVSAVTNHPLPAIRAYLSGRAAYRHADEKLAIENFTRALDIDSTFALAALDLTVATGKLVRGQVCQNSICRLYSTLPGFVSSIKQDELFNRAVRLGWQYRSALTDRDQRLLEALRGRNYPRESSSKETFAALSSAMSAAPDRPETHYLLGVLLLYQGTAMGLPDSKASAESEFREASRLDSSYLAPLARMVDVAAFQRDTSKVRRAALQYLARDTLGPTADYVRWMMVAASGNKTQQTEMRSRLRALSANTVDQIYLASQMSGFGLDDADSISRVILDKAGDPLEKSVALRRNMLFALNRGRPRQATDLLRQANDLRSSPNYTFRQFAIAGAVFNDGEARVADSSARDLAQSLARDTIGVLSADETRRISSAMSILAIWYFKHGDQRSATVASEWLRSHARGQARNHVLAILPEMLIASQANKPNAASLRAAVDSAALEGCCQLPDFVTVALAQAYEDAGDAEAALRTIRRGIWYQPPRNLSTYLREEGRLANQTGDRTGAIQAYDHYLALRSAVEPSQRPARDSVQAEVNRLRRMR